MFAIPRAYGREANKPERNAKMNAALTPTLRRLFFRIMTELNARYEPDERLAWPVTYYVTGLMPRIWFEGGALECIVMAEMTELFQKHRTDVCHYLATIMATHFCKQLAHDVHQELWKMTQASDLALVYGIDAEKQEDVVWRTIWRLLTELDVNHGIAASSLQASVRRLLVQRTVSITI